MKLSKAQQALHWRLWKQALPKLMPGRETWTKLEETEARHALYIQALGEDKSLTEMGNEDFDLVLGALRAIVDPTDLNAQLHALNGQKKRLLYGIRKLASEDYIQGIVHSMNAEGKLGGAVLEELHPRDLAKVMIALRKQEHRTEEKVVAGNVLQSVATMTEAILPLRKHSPEPLGASFTRRRNAERRHHRLVGGPMPSNHPF